MKKKIISFVLALMLFFPCLMFLSACGDSSDPEYTVKVKLVGAENKPIYLSNAFEGSNTYEFISRKDEINNIEVIFNEGYSSDGIVCKDQNANEITGARFNTDGTMWDGSNLRDSNYIYTIPYPNEDKEYTIDVSKCKLCKVHITVDENLAGSKYAIRKTDDYITDIKVGNNVSYLSNCSNGFDVDYGSKVFLFANNDLDIVSFNDIILYRACWNGKEYKYANQAVFYMGDISKNSSVGRYVPDTTIEYDEDGQFTYPGSLFTVFTYDENEVFNYYQYSTNKVLGDATEVKLADDTEIYYNNVGSSGYKSFYMKSMYVGDKDSYLDELEQPENASDQDRIITDRIYLEIEDRSEPYAQDLALHPDIFKGFINEGKVKFYLAKDRKGSEKKLLTIENVEYEINEYTKTKHFLVIERVDISDWIKDATNPCGRAFLISEIDNDWIESEMLSMHLNYVNGEYADTSFSSWNISAIEYVEESEEDEHGELVEVLKKHTLTQMSDFYGDEITYYFSNVMSELKIALGSGSNKSDLPMYHYKSARIRILDKNGDSVLPDDYFEYVFTDDDIDNQAYAIIPFNDQMKQKKDFYITVTMNIEEKNLNGEFNVKFSSSLIDSLANDNKTLLVSYDPNTPVSEWTEINATNVDTQIFKIGCKKTLYYLLLDNTNNVNDLEKWTITVSSKNILDKNTWSDLTGYSKVHYYNPIDEWTYRGSNAVGYLNICPEYLETDEVLEIEASNN